MLRSRVGRSSRWSSFRRSLPSFLAPKLGRFYLSMSVGLPETYEVGGYPVDPEDRVEYEERAEMVRSMGRTMDDEVTEF